MLRRGFDVSHLCALDGTLYMINGKNMYIGSAKATPTMESLFWPGGARR